MKIKRPIVYAFPLLIKRTHGRIPKEVLIYRMKKTVMENMDIFDGNDTKFEILLKVCSLELIK